MSAPASVEPVAIAVTPNRRADRVMFQFGDQTYALPVEDAAILCNHTLAAIEVLRPTPGTVQ